MLSTGLNLSSVKHHTTGACCRSRHVTDACYTSDTSDRVMGVWRAQDDHRVADRLSEEWVSTLDLTLSAKHLACRHTLHVILLFSLLHLESVGQFGHLVVCTVSFVVANCAEIQQFRRWRCSRACVTEWSSTRTRRSSVPSNLATCW